MSCCTSSASKPFEFSTCPRHKSVVQVLEDSLTFRPVEPAIVIDPSSHTRVHQPGKVLQVDGCVGSASCQAGRAEPAFAGAGNESLKAAGRTPQSCEAARQQAAVEVAQLVFDESWVTSAFSHTSRTVFRAIRFADLAARCEDAWVDRDQRKGEKPSDHAPVWANFR